MRAERARSVPSRAESEDGHAGADRPSREKTAAPPSRKAAGRPEGGKKKTRAHLSLFSLRANDATGDKTQIAKRQAVVNPENTFASVKRFIGRKMGEVAEESKQVSCDCFLPIFSLFQRSVSLSPWLCVSHERPLPLPPLFPPPPPHPPTPHK